VATGTLVPRGTLVKFLLYFDNKGGAVTDFRSSDPLAAGFGYVTGSLRSSNSVGACAAGACTGAEENAIFAAANAGAPATDAGDGDAASITGATVQIGKENAANAQVNLAAGKVWAVVFSVRTQ
jgi:hypothetical protein